MTLGDKNDPVARLAILDVSASSSQIMTTDNDDVYLGYSVGNGGSDKACHIPVDKSATAVILKIETGKPKENEGDQDTFTITLAQAPSISFELEGKLSVCRN